MRAWRTIIRVFAIINVVYVISGMYLLSDSVHRHYVLRLNARVAYYGEAFYGRSVVDLLFLIGLLVGSVLLLHLGRRGLLICNLVFGGEILYFFLDIALSLFAWSLGGKARSIGLAMSASAGTGEMGTSPQILTGYPVVALIVLNIAYHKLRQTRVLPLGKAGSSG